MAVQSMNPGGELYVYRIDELREEIGHAMAAISKNKLDELEESLWRQEVLCTGLKHLLITAQDTLSGTALDFRIQASLLALDQANRSYATLLWHAQVSNDLLFALCKSHHPDTQERVTSSRCSLEA